METQELRRGRLIDPDGNDIEAVFGRALPLRLPAKVGEDRKLKRISLFLANNREINRELVFLSCFPATFRKLSVL